jgi:transcriptional regulator with XRE-family HTH domain
MDEALKNLLSNTGDILRHLREESGLGQREVAAEIGATQATISYLENGKNDTFVGTLQRVANAYGHDIVIQFVPIEPTSVADMTEEQFMNALFEATEEE